MSTPPADYMLFWKGMLLTACCGGMAWTWLVSAFHVISGMEKKTWRRVLTALLLGPLLLRNRSFTR